MSARISVGLIVLFCGLVSAETVLSGVVHRITFDTTGNPYIVEQDVEIPADVEVTIGPGCVFLFKPFTQLQVHGRIVVNGTSSTPVVFTSINDDQYNFQSKQPPNPFDWNGIVIHEGAGAQFRNFSLNYSVFGIRAEEEGMVLRNGVFRYNGQQNLTIDGKVKKVVESFPFTLESSSDAEFASSDESGTPPSPTSKPKGLTRKQRRTLIRYVSLGVGAAGAIGCFATLPGTMSARKSYRNLNSQWPEYVDTYGVNAEQRYNEDLQANKETHQEKLTVTSILGGVGALGLLGFGATFYF